MLSRFQQAMGVQDVTELSDEEAGAHTPNTPAKLSTAVPEPPAAPKKEKNQSASASTKKKAEKPKPKTNAKGNAKAAPKPKSQSLKRPAAAPLVAKEANAKKENEDKEDETPAPEGNKRKKNNSHVHDEPVSKCHKCFYKKTGVYGLKIVTAKGSSEIMQARSESMFLLWMGNI